MELVVEIETVSDEAGRAAYAFIVTDTDSARAVHEAAHPAEHRDEMLVAYEALGRVLELLRDERPQVAQIHCTSRDLVDQITGTAVAEGKAAAMYEAAMMQLLKLDSWSLSARDRGENRRALQLAQEALADGGDIVSLDIDEAASRQQQRYTGVPQWTVELLDEPGEACPARCRAATRYPFGPDTPAGFCVYAAAVARADGPMSWSDATQQRMTTMCPHCDMPLRIVRV